MTESAPSSISTATSSATTPSQVLDYWLGDGIEKDWPTQDLGKRWFSGGAELDAEIHTRFGAAVDEALAGGLRDWEQPPLHRLALVILLDQFTRNIFRGTARAFAGDDRAQQLVRQAVAAGEDQQLPWAARLFLYMPLMHAESPALQDECVARFTRLVADAPEALKQRLQGNLDYAHQHRDIIKLFGRFPYRNAVLGRADTPEEQDFLQRGPRFGQ
ncbi:DUF924 family protein [Polaromonas sp. CT11-55]|uniref:DUF924 family protein n=1 Tax=Polaromonas sp. CT11-55 TaxID=3243045 RepID=UPI0039A5792D